MTTTNKGFSTRSGNEWGIDVLARATRQAASRTVREATKKGNLSMQKTLRSRIAAVAAVAVGAAVLSAAPSYAAATATLTPFSISNAESTAGARTTAVSATQIAGEGNYVSIGFNGTNYAYDGTFSATKAGFLTISGGNFTSTGAANATVNAAGTRADLTDSTSTTNVNVLTPTAGTITVKFVVRSWSSGVASDTTEQTFTITVGDATVNVYGSSKAYINADTSGAATADSTAAELTFTKTAGKRAIISVTQYDKQATPAALTSGFKAVTFSLSGVGALGTSSAATGSYVATSTPTSGARFDTYVYSDGRAGTATVTVSVNGVAVSTKTVTFYGSAASVTATAVKSNVNVAAVTGFTAPTQYVSVVVKDAAGVAVPSLTTLVAKSSSTATATVGTPVWNTTDLVYYVPVTAVATGSTTITVSDSTETYSGSVALKVTKAVASTVSLAFDKASYAPGEKVTLSVTAKDSNGDVVADGTYAGFFSAAATTSAAVTSTIFASGDVKFTNGVGTATFYAPLSGGTFTVSATTGTAATVATAAQGTALTATAKVVEDTTAIDAVKADVAKTQAAITALSTTIAGVQTAITALVASTTATLTLLQSQILKIMKKLGLK